MADMPENILFGRSTDFFGEAASKSESSDKSDASDQRPPFLTAESGTSRIRFVPYRNGVWDPTGTLAGENKFGLTFLVEPEAVFPCAFIPLWKVEISGPVLDWTFTAWETGGACVLIVAC